jgi:hypothetical protein
MRRILITLAVLFVLVAVAGSSHASPILSSITRVSGPSPFAPDGCGVSAARSEAEASPSVAANPLDAGNIVVAWEQDDALGVVVAATFDAGETWTRSVVPGLSVCSGSDMEHAFEPHLSFGPDGVVYLSTFSRGGEGPLPEDPIGVFGRVLVSSSWDGGRTWGDPVRIIDHDVLNDHETIAAEPDHSGAAVVLWTTFEAATAIAGEPTFMSRTTDHGATWTKSLVHIASPLTSAHNQIVALPDGTLIDVFEESKIVGFVTGEPEPAEIFATRSTDKGKTWSSRIWLGAGEAFRWPSATAAPNGDVSVAWRELDPDGAYRIRVTRSLDSGQSWSPSATVTAQPAGSVPWNLLTLPSPGITVSADGTIALVYHDLRNDVPGDDIRTIDTWLTHSQDGGLTWTESLVAAPFDLDSVPDGESGLGHGQSALTASGNQFLAGLVLAAPYEAYGPTDVYLSRSTVAG